MPMPHSAPQSQMPMPQNRPAPQQNDSKPAASGEANPFAAFASKGSEFKPTGGDFKPTEFKPKWEILRKDVVSGSDRYESEKSLLLTSPSHQLSISIGQTIPTSLLDSEWSDGRKQAAYVLSKGSQLLNDTPACSKWISELAVEKLSSVKQCD